MVYAVLAVAYAVGAVAFARPVPPFLTVALVARFMVAFGLPITATVIYLLFRSLWKHDTVRRCWRTAAIRISQLGRTPSS